MINRISKCQHVAAGRSNMHPNHEFLFASTCFQTTLCLTTLTNMRPWPCAEVRGGHLCAHCHAYHARAAEEDLVTKRAVLTPHVRCHGGRRCGSTASLVARRRRHRFEDRFLVTRCRSPRLMPMPQPSNVTAQYCNV